MANTAESPWTPPAGRHPVNVGASLQRALKARRGLQTKPGKNIPVSDFYLFRYQFKPESLDTSKPGTVEITQGSDVPSVRVEQAAYQSDEVHIFRGKEEPAKEVECVLIYNEEDGMWTLEKLDSSIHLSHERKGPAKFRLPSSPMPTPTPSGPSPEASNSNVVQDDSSMALETALLESLADVTSEAKIPPPSLPPPPSAVSAASSKPSTKGKKAENSKKSAAATSAAAPKAKATPKLSASNKNKGTANVKPVHPPLSASGSASLSMPPPPSGRSVTSARSVATAASSSNMSVSSGASAAPVGDADIETFNFTLEEIDDYEPAAAKPATQASKGGFAFPTAGSSFVSLPPPPPSAAAADTNSGWDEDADEEWENALNNTGAAEDKSGAGGSMFGVDEDIDRGLLDTLENEMVMLDEDVNVDDIFGDDGEEDSDDDMELVDATQTRGAPISMNEFAGMEGGLDVDDDDDDSDSSDEDSDDE